MELQQYTELEQEQNIHWWFRGKRNIVIDLAYQNHRPNKNDKILDIGCGMGLMLNELQKYGDVYGMDMEQQAVTYCQNTYFKKSPSDANAHIKIGFLPFDVPFEKSFFDNIFALDVIEHIEDDMDALNTIHDLLKSNGRLIATVPAHMSLWSYNDELNHHCRRYERKDLMAVVQKAGFHIQKCSYYNSLLYPAVWLIRKIKNMLHIQSSDIKEKANASFINEVLYLLFKSEKYWLRQHHFPTGVSLILLAEKI